MRAMMSSESASRQSAHILHLLSGSQLSTLANIPSGLAQTPSQSAVSDVLTIGPEAPLGPANLPSESLPETSTQPSETSVGSLLETDTEFSVPPGTESNSVTQTPTTTDIDALPGSLLPPFPSLSSANPESRFSGRSSPPIDTSFLPSLQVPTATTTVSSAPPALTPIPVPSASVLSSPEKSTSPSPVHNSNHNLNTERKRSDTGALVGGVVAGTVLVACVLCTILYFRGYRRIRWIMRRKPNISRDRSRPESGISQDAIITPPPVVNSSLRESLLKQEFPNAVAGPDLQRAPGESPESSLYTLEPETLLPFAPVHYINSETQSQRRTSSESDTADMRIWDQTSSSFSFLSGPPSYAGSDIVRNSSLRSQVSTTSEDSSSSMAPPSYKTSSGAR